MRHLNSQVHKADFQEFCRLVNTQGRSPKDAADTVIQLVKIRMEKRRLSFSNSLTGKENRLVQEICLFSWLVCNGISFNSVEHKMFLEYHSTMKWMLPPQRRRLGATMMDVAYGLAMRHLRQELNSVDYFSITTDAWTSVIMQKFIALNLSAVVPGSFELLVRTLAVIPLSESHTWQAVTVAIATRLQNALPGDAMLVATVTDNA